MDTERKTNRRDNVVYKFHIPNLEGLFLFVKRSTSDSLDMFAKDYGRILSCLKSPLTKHQKDGLLALLQFYDHELRCFMFPVYLLAPTLQEYSTILNILILYQVPFHPAMEKPDDRQIAAALYLG